MGGYKGGQVPFEDMVWNMVASCNEPCTTLSAIGWSPTVVEHDGWQQFRFMVQVFWCPDTGRTNAGTNGNLFERIRALVSFINRWKLTFSAVRPPGVLTALCGIFSSTTSKSMRGGRGGGQGQETSWLCPPTIFQNSHIPQLNTPTTKSTNVYTRENLDN